MLVYVCFLVSPWNISMKDDACPGFCSPPSPLDTYLLPLCLFLPQRYTIVNISMPLDHTKLRNFLNAYNTISDESNS